MRQCDPKGSRLSLSTVVDLISQLASALQYAHDRHLVHRDVKPENMLCRADGTVLLSDFGIASVAHATDSVSAYQAFGGTLPYMAPEQHEGHPRLASDQYALAVVAYEWLAGTRPFQGTVPELVAQHLSAPPPSLLAQVPGLPVEVEQVLFKALSKQPNARYPRIEEFAVALSEAGQPPWPSRPEMSPSPTASAPTQSPSRSSLPAGASAPLVNEPAVLAQPSLPRETSIVTEPTRSHPPVVAPPLHSTPSNWRRLVAIILLLVALGSSSLIALAVLASRPPVLSPAQATAATMTADARTTAQQGVMFGFDAAHTHFNPYEHTLGPGNVSRLTALWSYATGSVIQTSPAVAGGMVYIGSFDAKLYAFDATCRKSCQSLWSGTTGGPIVSSPTVAGGLVYVSSQDAKLYAFGLPA